jgi:hypothetical protein
VKKLNLVVLLCLLISASSVFAAGWPQSEYDLWFSNIEAINNTQPGVCPQTLTFSANFAGSPPSSCGSNPNESDTYTVKIAGSAIGTVTISTSCVATFATAGGSPEVCLPGQRIELVKPITVSGTNIAITIVGAR